MSWKENDTRKGKLQEKQFEGREFQTKVNDQESKRHFYMSRRAAH